MAVKSINTPVVVLIKRKKNQLVVVNEETGLTGGGCGEVEGGRTVRGLCCSPEKAFLHSRKYYLNNNQLVVVKEKTWGCVEVEGGGSVREYKRDQKSVGTLGLYFHRRKPFTPFSFHCDPGQWKFGTKMGA